METPNINQQVRTYFLQQGQSISKLHNTLSSNVFVHHLKKWLSIIIELTLYLLFIGIVVFAIIIPTDIEYSISAGNNDALSAGYHNEDLAFIILCIKIILIILSLPILIFAIVLGRNRKKNNLLRSAFEETQKMKLAFDKALKELNL